MSHILVVEDEAIIRQSVRRLLQRHNYEVTDVDSLHAAKELDLSAFDLVISDLRLPGGMGTELLDKAGNTPVLIMTSYASLRSAVDAMKLGAVDYIAKPFDHEEMINAVKNILAAPKTNSKASTTTNTATSSNSSAELGDEYPQSRIIGSSEPMKTLFKRISKVAPTDATVLILGESGTGKELVARALHDQSRRKDAPMISVNCAAI